MPQEQGADRRMTTLKLTPRTGIAIYLAIGLADALYGWSAANPMISTSDLIKLTAWLVLLWPAELATIVAPGLCAHWQALCR